MGCPLPRTAILILLALSWGPGALAHVPHDVVLTAEASPSFGMDGVIFAHAALSEHHVLARSVDGGRTWLHQGHAMVQHGVSAFVFSPDFAADQTCFAATTGGGVFVTRDGGDSWTGSNDGLASLEVAGLAVSPTFARDGLVAVATADGCHVSLDEGRSWTRLDGGLPESDLSVVAFVPGRGALPRLLTGGLALHRLVPGAEGWQTLASFPSKLSGLAPSPTDPRALAVSLEGDGVHLSVDGGRSFAPGNEGLTDTRVADLEAADDGTLFAATVAGGVFRAEVPGGPWTRLDQGLEPPAPQSDEHYFSVQALPDFGASGTVLLGAFEGCYLSPDRGESWNQLDIYGLRVNRDLAVSPDFREDRTVILGNYGGGVLMCRFTEDGRLVLRDEVPAHRWRARGDNIPNLFSGTLAVSPEFARDGTVFSAYTKLGRTTSQGQSWKNVTLPLEVSVVRGIAMSPAYALDGLVLFGTPAQGVWRSVNGGDSWSFSGAGVPLLARGRGFVFSPDFAADGTVIYATRNLGMFRSVNRGLTWSAVNEGLSDPDVRALAISPAFGTDHTLFVGTGQDGVFISRDRGETWEVSNAGLPDLAGVDVEGLAVSPEFARDRTVFLTSQRSGVFRSDDGGASWTPRNRGLGRGMPRRIAVVPDFPRDPTVFLVTHDWVWVSRDAGERWSRLDGFLRTPDDHPQVIYSGTWTEENHPQNHGRSASVSVVPGSSFEYGFEGRKLAWFASQGPEAGRVVVRVDGAFAGRVDLQAPEQVQQQRVWEHDLGTVGWHVVQVEVVPRAPGEPGGERVESDGLEIVF